MKSPKSPLGTYARALVAMGVASALMLAAVAVRGQECACASRDLPAIPPMIAH